MQAWPFPMGNLPDARKPSRRGPVRRERGRDEGPDTLEGGVDAGVGPLRRVSRVVKAGGRVEHRAPGGDRVRSHELPARDPVGDDPGDLPREGVDVRPDRVPRAGGDLQVGGEQLRVVERPLR
jgi:hypothetical protein